MPTPGLYKGFSSFEFERIKTFNVYDVELVKLDILNHIFTRRGSRVMMPNFGTLIPQLAFEPLDNQTLEVLTDELQTVFDYDPRVELVDLNVNPSFDTNAVTVSARLYYVELDTVDIMNLNIEFAT